jgi:hypothetical protein
MIQVLSIFLLVLLFLLIRKNREVLRLERFSNSNTNLEFVHIPKNAGTSIENAAEKAGINWGFKQWTKPGVPKYGGNLFKLPGEWINSKYNVKYISKDTSRNTCFPWHEIPDNMPDKIYGKNSKTFCVVRDPYSKIVSAYKYWRGKTATKTDLNHFIQTRLPNFDKNVENMRWNSGHILPQHMYTHGKRKCEYIIRFENLDTEFGDLMKKFNITDIKLEKNNKSAKTVSVSDLDNASRELIKKAYKRDFELFNYPM